jgi:hypothetical protein
MSQPSDSRSPKTPDDPRKIGRWARAYAQNRSLGVVVFMVIYLILTAAIGVPSYYVGMAYSAEQWPLFWGCIAVLIVAAAAVFYLSMPWWGGKLIERVVKRLYAEEGGVQVAPCPTRRRRWIGGILGAAFGSCIVASIVIGFLYDIPDKYMQPISAIYFVPFTAGLWLLMRPAVGSLALLWPLLYALHAILILAGAPILFVTRPWDSLNMLIPTCGYGLLSAVISHVYSRFALSKLRRAARDGLQDQTTQEPQP